MRFLIFVIIAVSAELEWKCPYLWEIDRLTNICYKVVHREVYTHSEAESACSEMGAALGAINTREKFQTVDKIFQKGWRILHEYYPADRVWISSTSSYSNRSINSTDCLSFLPSRVPQKAHIEDMPCVFGQPARPCRGEFKNIHEPICYPVEHILCEANWATQEEVSLYCDEGWSLFEGRKVCHKVFRERISSIDGVKAFCQSYSANISMILSEAENDFIRELTMNGWYVNHLEFENRAWIGAREVPGTEEYQWNNGEKVDIHRIFKGRPSESNECLTFHPRSLESRWRKLYGVFCDPWQYLRNKDVPQVLCEKPATDRKATTTQTQSFSTKPCADGWHIFPGSSRCHKLFQIGVSTMEGAKRICQVKGGRLSSLRSKEEVKFAAGLMQLGWKMYSNDIFYDHVWAALTKDDTSGKWKWNGNDRLAEELGDVVPNSFISSNCAAFQPFSFLNGKENFFEEVPCDTDFRRLYTYPPSHILCEREDDEFISSANASPNSVECPANWHFHENSKMCIKLFVESTTSFQQAQNKCVSEGGHLVSVNTDDKREFVIGLKEHGWRLRKTDLSRSSTWIGLKKEGETWKWLNGDPFDVSMFQSDEWEHNTNCGLMLPNDKVLDTGKYGAVLDSKCELLITIEHLVCEKNSVSNEFSKFYIIIGISALSLLIVLLVFTLFLLLLRRKNTKLRKQPVQENIHLFASPPSSEEYYNVSEESLKLEDIEIVKKIGSGKFGCVYLAEMSTDPPIKVAVKTCRIDGYQQHLNVLSSELSTLIKLPKHPNIVTLLGSVAMEIKSSGQIYIVLELCELGSIHSFLSKFQISNYVNELYRAKEERRNVIAGKLRTTDLLVFSEQIANGMCHLAENNCIHRDIAARNILLTSNFICKISDFGMARIVEPNYYNIQTTDSFEMEAFPQRWMAPESLESNVFSFATDVWSFGIVLYELFSLATIPFFKFSASDIRGAIMRGEINEQPEYCHDDIYALMQRCWDREASKRPSIQECRDFLKHHLNEAFHSKSDYLNDDLYSERIRLDEIRNRLKPTTYYNG